MKTIGTAVALIALVAVFLAPALAQNAKGTPSPALEEEHMTRMMKMIGEMEQQMGQMQEQMKGMQGMGGMQGRMGQMRGSMEQMRAMMQEHGAWMKDRCPAAPKNSK
jgi:TolA-binding protein